MEKPNMWVRVAGNTKNIKGKLPHVWRCYFQENQTEIPLKGIKVEGMSNTKNVIWQSNADKDEHGLIAWVDYFGSCTIENEILHIKLAEPTSPPPWNA